MEKHSNRVTTQYQASGSDRVAVYGKYRDYGYEVNPVHASFGDAVPSHVSPREAFAIADMNWTIQTRKSYYEDERGQPKASPDRVSLVRSDTDIELATVGLGYTVVQNDSLIQLFDRLDGIAAIENILQIREGRKVYVTARVGVEDEVTKGDPVRRYLHLVNSHDGSSAFGVFFTDIRLACANQLSFLSNKEMGNAAARGQGLKRRHTACVSEFAQMLPDLIDVQRQRFNTNIEELRAMAKAPLKAGDLHDALRAIYHDKLAKPIRDKGVERPRELKDLKEYEPISSNLYEGTGYGIEKTGHTVYSLYQSITQYETHDSGRLKDPIANARRRLENLWGGSSVTRISAAHTKCLELCKA